MIGNCSLVSQDKCVCYGMYALVHIDNGMMQTSVQYSTVVSVVCFQVCSLAKCIPRLRVHYLTKHDVCNDPEHLTDAA